MTLVDVADSDSDKESDGDEEAEGEEREQILCIILQQGQKIYAVANDIVVDLITYPDDEEDWLKIQWSLDVS